MIYLYEQFGYQRTGFLQKIEDEQKQRLQSIQTSVCRKTVFRQGKESLCVCVDYDSQKAEYHFETSYFVGIDWLVEGKIATYVQPKQNAKDIQIDYIKMLTEAMQEPENFNHLEDLLTIRFNQPTISVKQTEDILSPFLITQYLYLLRAIVRKGLKRSYYPITENLNAKIKGKILIHSTIQKNILKGRQTKTVCRYPYFGLNNDENKILKKAYSFACRAIRGYKGIKTETLEPIIHYIHPAFETIEEDIEVDKIRSFKPNPFYKEYEQALKLALLILKRYSYNINQTETEYIDTPPFWIDMSKLFELYVFKKLKQIFPSEGEVIYHYKTKRQEIDFIVNSKDTTGREIKLVIDAKYKPRYEYRKVETKDIRQLAGYARMKSVYRELGIEEEDYSKNIDCLIIYSNQKAKGFLIREELYSTPDPDYVHFYKVGIKLPIL